MPFSVDTSIFDKKIKELNEKVPKIIQNLVIQAHDIVMKDVQKMVKGPYNPGGSTTQRGRIPIPRVSKMLAKSIVTESSKTKKTVYIISKGAIAPHNYAVHYGRKNKWGEYYTGLPPRRFIEDPVSKNLIPILQLWNREFYKAIK